MNLLTRVLPAVRRLQYFTHIWDPLPLLTRTMASTTAVAKLPVPLRDLVANAATDGSSDFGKSEKDKAEVTEWIEKIAEGEVVKPQNLKVRV